MADSLELVKRIVAAIQDKKGKDISVLDLNQISLIADYFVICTGNSSIQVQAISDHIEEELGRPAARKEGYKDATWILLDYHDVVVHIFQEETRKFYDLERLWGDARQLTTV